MNRTAAPPLVSVVLPVYNGAGTIAEAVASILDQTLRDIEVVVVDDGSVDGTLDVVRAIDDPRLVILAEPTHRGLVACLQRGIEHARSEVIARMDADDLAYPDRLALQYDLFAADPDVGLAATAFFNLAGDDPRAARFVGVPPDHSAARFALVFSNCLAHSTVMFRRAVFDAVGGYDEARFPAEDYDLWLRMIAVTRFASVPSPQMTRRESITGLSATRQDAQQEIARDLAAQTIERLTGTRPSTRIVGGLTAVETGFGCSDFDSVFGCVHAVYRAVADDCRARGISTRPLPSRLPRMLLRCGLRRPDGRLCREQVALLVARHPALSAQVGWAYLRKIARERFH